MHLVCLGFASIRLLAQPHLLSSRRCWQGSVTVLLRRDHRRELLTEAHCDVGSPLRTKAISAGKVNMEVWLHRLAQQELLAAAP